MEETKQAIQDKEGIPLDQQRLIFNGVQLEDYLCLADYEVESCHQMQLLLRLRGGMMHETSGRYVTKQEQLQTFCRALSNVSQNQPLEKQSCNNIEGPAITIPRLHLHTPWTWA